MPLPPPIHHLGQLACSFDSHCFSATAGLECNNPCSAVGMGPDGSCAAQRARPQTNSGNVNGASSHKSVKRSRCSACPASSTAKAASSIVAAASSPSRASRRSLDGWVAVDQAVFQLMPACAHLVCSVPHTAMHTLMPQPALPVLQAGPTSTYRCASGSFPPSMPSSMAHAAALASSGARGIPAAASAVTTCRTGTMRA